MGYDLFITRRSWPYDDDGPEISAEEWRHFVSGESAWLITEDPQCPDSLMTQWDQLHDCGEQSWIEWDEGQAYSKNPDSALRIEMYRISQLLGARVIGEEGEQYGPDGELVDTGSPTLPNRSWLTRIKQFFGGR